MDNSVKHWVSTALASLCLTAAVAAECDCFYPYGIDQGDTDFPFKESGETLNSFSHKEWDVSNIASFTVYTDSGYILYSDIEVEYWRGAGINMTANPNYHIFYRRTIDANLIARAKNDVISVFGDTAFEPYVLVVLTVANFTYDGGDATTKTNTVQLVTMIDQPGTKTYMQMNFDIDWWHLNNNYPQIGILRNEPNGVAGDKIIYALPGSGSPEIEKVVKTGNTGVPNRWMLTNTLYDSPTLLGIPNGHLAIGRITSDGTSNYTSCCYAGYDGKMCQTNIDYCVSNPCVNGNCSQDGLTGYLCQCQMGFTGTRCDVNIDDCAANPCANGCCEDLVNGYTCQCYPGWTGQTCDSPYQPGNFGNWSECTKSCDVGIQRRCSDAQRGNCEYRTCNAQACPAIPEELTASVLLSTKKSLKSVVLDETDLKAYIAKRFNKFCSSNTAECCSILDKSAKTNVNISAATEADVKFASGSPMRRDEFTIVVRIVMYIPNNFTSVCIPMEPSTNTGENLLVPVKVLTKALGSVLGSVDDDICCYTIGSPVLQDPAPVAVIVGVVLGLIILILVVVIVILQGS